MAFCNFPYLCLVQEFNECLNIGLNEGMCDSTYLGRIEILVEIKDEDSRFFGVHIREAIKTFKEVLKKII